MEKTEKQEDGPAQPFSSCDVTYRNQWLQALRQRLCCYGSEVQVSEGREHSRHGEAVSPTKTVKRWQVEDYVHAVDRTRRKMERNTQLRGWETGGRGIHSGEGGKQEREEYTAERVGSRRERNTQLRGWEAGGRGIHS